MPWVRRAPRHWMVDLGIVTFFSVLIAGAAGSYVLLRYLAFCR